MKTKMILLSLSCALLLPFGALARDVKIQINGSAQLNPQARAKNACYIMAESMKAAGLPASERVLKKQSISVLPADLFYTVYESEMGSSCALLDERKTQFLSDGHSQALIAGCICDLVVPIK